MFVWFSTVGKKICLGNEREYCEENDHVKQSRDRHAHIFSTLYVKYKCGGSNL